jgi:hypothetical protein
MLKRLRPELPAGCVSDLRLDALRAQELSADDEAQIDAHLRTCKRCQARRRVLDTDSDVVRARLVPFAAPRRADPPRARVGRLRLRERMSGRMKHASWLGAAAALAAALGLALLPRQDVDGGIRAKGSPGLTFYVKRGSDVYESLPDQPVAPGDVLRFVVAPTGFAYVAILSRSAGGQASVYFPQGALAAPIEADASKHALEGAVELDDTIEDEQIHAVFCRTSFELAPLRQELASTATIAARPGCEVTTLALHKVPVP